MSSSGCNVAIVLKRSSVLQRRESASSLDCNVIGVSETLPCCDVVLQSRSCEGGCARREGRYGPLDCGCIDGGGG